MTPDSPGTVDDIAVLIVDDDPLARSALRTILAHEVGLTVVGECSDGSEVMAATRSLHPTVILLDIHMPHVDGVSTVRLLHGLDHPPHVLMMTAWDDAEKLIAAVTAGAAGFLLKDDDRDSIVRAIHTVASGDAAFSPRSASHLKRVVVATATNPARLRAHEQMDALTEREREVAYALVSGASDSEVAGQLHIAPSTVKSTLAGIHTKWGTRNRTQVAVMVVRSER